MATSPCHSSHGASANIVIECMSNPDLFQSILSHLTLMSCSALACAHRACLPRGTTVIHLLEKRLQLKDVRPWNYGQAKCGTVTLSIAPVFDRLIPHWSFSITCFVDARDGVPARTIEVKGLLGSFAAVGIFMRNEDNHIAHLALDKLMSILAISPDAYTYHSQFSNRQVLATLINEGPFEALVDSGATVAHPVERIDAVHYSLKPRTDYLKQNTMKISLQFKSVFLRTPKTATSQTKYCRTHWTADLDSPFVTDVHFYFDMLHMNNRHQRALVALTASNRIRLSQPALGALASFGMGSQPAPTNERTVLVDRSVSKMMTNAMRQLDEREVFHRYRRSEYHIDCVHQPPLW